MTVFEREKKNRDLDVFSVKAASYMTTDMIIRSLIKAIKETYAFLPSSKIFNNGLCIFFQKTREKISK